MPASLSFNNYQLISQSFDLADVQTFNYEWPRCLEPDWPIMEIEIGLQSLSARSGLKKNFSHFQKFRGSLVTFLIGIILLILVQVSPLELICS